MAYNYKNQSVYKKKLKQFKVQYNLQDNIDGLRLQKYLTDNNMSANAYIKQLIKSDLDSKNVPYPYIDNTDTADNN